MPCFQLFNQGGVVLGVFHLRPTLLSRPYAKLLPQSNHFLINLCAFLFEGILALLQCLHRTFPRIILNNQNIAAPCIWGISPSSHMFCKFLTAWLFWFPLLFRQDVFLDDINRHFFPSRCFLI